MVAFFNANTWPNLELPLSWHDLCISSWNFDSRIKACLIMHISYCSTKAGITSNWTIIRPLISGISTLWPPMWSISKCIWIWLHSILLLDTKPRFLLKISIKYGLCKMSEISCGWHQHLISIIHPCKCLS